MGETRTEPERAGRLLSWGLDPKARPVAEPEYQELVNHYLDHPQFRALVRDMARGLGLEVLDVGERGLVVVPREGAIFEMRPADYRPTSGAADDRLLDGLVLLAIVTTLYPRPKDLEGDPTTARPPVTVEEVEDTLRQLVGRLSEEAEGEPDPTTVEIEQGLIEAWEVYDRQVASSKAGGKRRSHRATRSKIAYGLQRLTEFGCFHVDGNGGNALYTPTWRFQVMVQDFAASRLYRTACRLVHEANEEG